MTFASDSRYLDHVTDSDAVLVAYVGTDRDHCDTPMGAWTDDDVDAFMAAVTAQHVADIGRAPTFLVILDADGNDVDEQYAA